MNAYVFYANKPVVLEVHVKKEQNVCSGEVDHLSMVLLPNEGGWHMYVCTFTCLCVHKHVDA